MRLGVVALMLALAAFVAPESRASDECSYVRLDQPGPWGVPDPGKPPAQWRGSMQHIPVADQGAVGICYTYTAMEMMDAYRFSMPPPQGDRNFAHRSSPIEGGIGYRETSGLVSRAFYGALHIANRASGSTEYHKVEGGMACGVVDYWKKKGSCSATDVDSHLYQDPVLAQLAQDSTGHQQSVIHFRKQVWTFASSPERTYDSACFPEPLDADAPAIAVPAEGAADAVENAYEHHQLSCSRQAVNPRLNCDQDSPVLFRARRIKSKINAYLNQHAPVQPVGINFCSRLLTQGTGTFSYLHPVDLLTGCGLHAATVIGRRRDPQTGKCQFLLRNSWGTSCFHYAPRFQAQCENGNIWIDDSDLADNTMTTMHLN